MANTTPNLYQLSSRAIHVTYATSGIDGKPHFQYQDPHQSLSFSGGDIRVADTDLGSLVSVSIRRTIDAGGTSFSVMIPRVVLVDEKPVAVDTRGVTVVHRFSIVPAFNRGQLDAYSVVKLKGTASFVVF